MAVLTDDQKTQMRHICERSGIPINYLKAQINAAFQAVEDILTGTALKTALSNAIDTAASPLTLTAEQKKEIVKAVIERLTERWT